MTISFDFGNSNIESSIRKSLIEQNSKADITRFTNMAQKVSEGKIPVGDVCEFLDDKISDKHRKTLITVASIAAVAVGWKKFGDKITPLVKQAGKSIMNIMPQATQKKWTPKIVNFLRKDLSTVPFVKKFSGLLAKGNVYNVGNAMKWGAAGAVAVITSKLANKAGDKVDDVVDIKKLEKAEEA